MFEYDSKIRPCPGLYNEIYIYVYILLSYANSQYSQARVINTISIKKGWSNQAEAITTIEYFCVAH